MKWKGLLWQVGDAAISLIKADLCCSSSHIQESVSKTVTSAFESDMNEILSLFHKNMQASVYYVAGWHIRAALKASKKRKGKMKRILQRLAENGTATLEEVQDLPISKVLKSDQYGGLCYVSNAYFQIIIRLEYIFVKLLTISKLCVLGKDLIKTVYQCIHENDLFSDSVVRILDNNTFDSDVIDTLLKYLARTYCRMRGKDFCQALMQKDFNNLGQGIRNVTAAIAEINKDKVKK